MKEKLRVYLEIKYVIEKNINFRKKQNEYTEVVALERFLNYWLEPEIEALREDLEKEIKTMKKELLNE